MDPRARPVQPVFEPGEERHGGLHVHVAEAGGLVGHAGRVERLLEAVVLVEPRAVAAEPAYRLALTR